MQFSKKLPSRKRKARTNPVVDDPTFVQFVKAMRDGVPQAALIFTPEDAERFLAHKPKIEFPWRVATDTIRRLVAAEHLSYKVGKYKTDAGGWAVTIRKEEGPPQKVKAATTSAQKRDQIPTEEGRRAKSA